MSTSFGLEGKVRYDSFR